MESQLCLNKKLQENIEKLKSIEDLRASFDKGLQLKLEKVNQENDRMDQEMSAVKLNVDRAQDKTLILRRKIADTEARIHERSEKSNKTKQEILIRIDKIDCDRRSNKILRKKIMNLKDENFKIEDEINNFYDEILRKEIKTDEKLKDPYKFLKMIQIAQNQEIIELQTLIQSNNLPVAFNRLEPLSCKQCLCNVI